MEHNDSNSNNRPARTRSKNNYRFIAIIVGLLTVSLALLGGAGWAGMRLLEAPWVRIVVASLESQIKGR